MTTLYFQKISKFNRTQEPVSVSIPFAQGKLPQPEHLVIKDGQSVLPSQNQPLAHWPDDSIKWLLVHFQPDLPGNADKTCTFEINNSVSPIAPESSVRVIEDESGLHVDTGPLQFTIPRDGFLPVRDVKLNGEALAQGFGGFVLNYDSETVTTAAGSVHLSLEEAGPLRAVIEIMGQHHKADGSGCLDLRGRITAYAGKPYIEVEHQFVHTEEAAELSLRSLELTFAPAGKKAAQVALGQGYYQTAIKESSNSLDMALTAELLLYQANEHYVDSFYGDFWVDWRAAPVGLALSIHQAHQNFPKKLLVDPDKIVCSLYPAEESPARVLQGMGKTHRILLHFHGAATPLDEISSRSLQFQLPDIPALPRRWYRENNPWEESFFPEKLPGRLINLFTTLHDSRPAAMGMFHFGDAPDAHYTNQGRGNGETVWVNNEYDRPHACTLFYALTGQRHVLDSALVTARHWLDVDFCHYNPDPLINGGLRIHDVYHATGKVIPSHQWIEGFLDFYFLTGRREALEAANSIGENIMRHTAQPEMRDTGATSVRENGWALRAMVGLWLGTGDEKWKDEARRIVEMFIAWLEEFDGLLAPYTSHSMPRVPFMISLTVNSMARYLLIEKDARIEKFIVRAVDDLLAHNIGPDGIFYYKELPSLRRPAPTPHALEALTHAYRITGDSKYLRVAARQFAALSERAVEGGGGKKYVDASGAVVRGEGGGRVFADKYISTLLFAGEAARLNLLDWYEFPFADV